VEISYKKLKVLFGIALVYGVIIVPILVATKNYDIIYIISFISAIIAACAGWAYTLKDVEINFN